MAEGTSSAPGTLPASPLLKPTNEARKVPLVAFEIDTSAMRSGGSVGRRSWGEELPLEESGVESSSSTSCAKTGLPLDGEDMASSASRRRSAKRPTDVSAHTSWRPTWASRWPDDQGISFEEVLTEEVRHIKRQNDLRFCDGRRSTPFALAFSGGGIRAAAFQAGVLWRLAQANLLKDVEVLAAVSGGGYIASAFASYCFSSQPPAEGEVKAWYIDVVARCLSRMQDNAGNFVRDCVKNPYGPVDGAGKFPRWLDLPILLASLFLTLGVNPVVFLICCMVPFTSAVEVFLGAGMRAAFCDPEDDWLKVLLKWTPIDKMAWTAGTLCVMTFVAWVLTKVLSCCKLSQDADGRWSAPTGYLLGHTVNAFLVRLTSFLIFLLAFSVSMPAVQIGLYTWEGHGAKIKKLSCAVYISNLTKNRDEGIMDCGNYFDGRRWFEDKKFKALTSDKAWPEIMEEVQQFKKNESNDSKMELSYGILSYFFIGFLALMGLSVVMVPVLGAELSLMVLTVFGPIALFVLTMYVVQVNVFGPITDPDHGSLQRLRRHSWTRFETWSLMMALVLLPLYPWIRAALHNYYKRSLQGNFFPEGKDISFSELLRCHYCPFLILTGTTSDYQPPGDTDLISEIYFSPLHCGGDEIGYLRMPVHRSLAKCTALTGAGCLDAISLTMTDAMSLRFWLEVLNLTWGDYILFERFPIKWIKAIAKGSRHEASIDRFFHFLPTGIMWSLMFIMINMGHHLGHNTANTDRKCRDEKLLYLTAGYVLLLMLLLSFIEFLPFHDLLASDPLLREIQQATKYFHVGHRPPRMLYVTDGGVKDCTGILQLLRRRVRRILLVLAAADAFDDLKVLVAAMEASEAEKIASFFNPKDPRESLAVLFDAFKQDPSMPYLHIGVFYSWDSEEHNREAEIFVVKNRLPPHLVADPVKPPYTEEEIRGEGGPLEAGFATEGWGYMTTDQLGSFGCCDCCHTRGLNCGPKFPHGSFAGYMYLTPMWCNSLVRLGHDISAPVVEALLHGAPSSKKDAKEL